MDARQPQAADLPLVSIITATYNYSSVLRYAIQSVLWQSYPNFELWVIGDACTDDSEAVVASFGDSRIHWINLPENSGSQSVPNNEGIARARGKYVAYLGHDDLWYPNHLEVLVEALERTGADAAHTLLLMNQPQAPQHTLYGLSTSEESHSFIVVPPSSLMHLRTIVEDTGLWKDYRTLRIPPDIDFVGRFAHSGKQFITVMELTVFKFPSARRKNIYIDQPSHEQAAYVEGILHDPDFRYRELMAVISEWTTVRQALEMTFTPPTLEPGVLVESWREYRGLKPQTPLPAVPLLEDMITLIQFNPLEDITPAAGRKFLHQEQRLPKNGVLIGGGWHGLERDAEGRPFRWLGTEADVLLTELDQQPWQLSMDVWLGYANDGQPVTVDLVSDDPSILEQAYVTGEQRLSFYFTPQRSGTAICTLRVVGSQNNPLPNDSRILNVGVRSITLESVPTASEDQAVVPLHPPQAAEDQAADPMAPPLSHSQSRKSRFRKFIESLSDD